MRYHLSTPRLLRKAGPLVFFALPTLSAAVDSHVTTGTGDSARVTCPESQPPVMAGLPSLVSLSDDGVVVTNSPPRSTDKVVEYPPHASAGIPAAHPGHVAQAPPLA